MNSLEKYLTVITKMLNELFLSFHSENRLVAFWHHHTPIIRPTDTIKKGIAQVIPGTIPLKLGTKKGKGVPTA